MNIIHWVHAGASGLISTTKVLGKYEEKLGHGVELRDPSTNATLLGKHFEDNEIDIHCIHHQFHYKYLKDDKPKFIFLHGEPSYCVSTPGALEATYNMMAICDAAISFQQCDTDIWETFGRVHTIRKGIDLEVFKPPEEKPKKEIGKPSILYMEHWHWSKNPLYTVVAVERIQKMFPEVALYLVGCPQDQSTRWATMCNRNRWGFVKGLKNFWENPQSEIPKFDIVVSPVFPSYGIVPMEAIACGVPVVGYDCNPDVTFPCKPYDIVDMCRAIMKAVQEPANPVTLRKYAEQTFSGEMMAEDVIKIYETYHKAFKGIRNGMDASSDKGKDQGPGG